MKGVISMSYMNKEVTFLKSNEKGNYTYITPNQIITTNKHVAKITNCKTN